MLKNELNSILDEERKKQNNDIENRNRKLQNAPNTILESIKHEAQQKVREGKFSTKGGKNIIKIELWTSEGLYYESNFWTKHVRDGFYVKLYPNTIERLSNLAKQEGIIINSWGLSCRNDMIKKRYNTSATARNGYLYQPLLWITCTVSF